MNLKSEISNLKSNAEGISRQLRGWANSLQNSDIAGQRHLNDRSRKSYEQKQRGTEFTDRIREMAEQVHLEREAKRSQQTEPSPIFPPIDEES